MSRRTSPGLIWLTVLLAVLMMLFPVSPQTAWLQPYWVALVMIYWNLESPGNIGLGAAFLIGIILDVAIGSLLGQHALSLVIITYLVSRFRLRVRFFPLWQQALAVFVLMLNDRFIYAWVHALSDNGLPGWQILLAPIVAMLIWPWLFLLLDAVRRRLRSR